MTQASSANLCGSTVLQILALQGSIPVSGTQVAMISVKENRAKSTQTLYSWLCHFDRLTATILGAGQQGID